MIEQIITIFQNFTTTRKTRERKKTRIKENKKDFILTHKTCKCHVINTVESKKNVIVHKGKRKTI